LKQVTFRTTVKLDAVAGIDNDIKDLAVFLFPVKVKHVMGRDNRGCDHTVTAPNRKHDLVIRASLDIRRERRLGGTTHDTHANRSPTLGEIQRGGNQRQKSGIAP
jgi:hypothetical protein